MDYNMFVMTALIQSCNHRVIAAPRGRLVKLPQDADQLGAVAKESLRGSAIIGRCDCRLYVFSFLECRGHRWRRESDGRPVSTIRIVPNRLHCCYPTFTVEN